MCVSIYIYITVYIYSIYSIYIYPMKYPPVVIFLRFFFSIQRCQRCRWRPRHSRQKTKVCMACATVASTSASMSLPREISREIPGTSMGKSWCVYVGNVPWYHGQNMLKWWVKCIEMSSIIIHPWKSRWITGLFFTHQIHRLAMDWWIWWPSPPIWEKQHMF